MKAIVYKQYGSPQVLQLREIEKPTPKDNEVLIRIRATTVSSGDVRLRKANPFAVRLLFGFTRPKISVLGGVLSGEIEALGKNVRRFKVHDQVFGTTGMTFGAYAEYICLPENGVLAIKPHNMSFEEAASIPFGANTALHFLRQGNIKRGHKVLVYGASGAIGVAAVQLAKYFGAEVTGICSTANVELVKSLGADEVIDYSKNDFTKNGNVYDIIFDTVGKSSFSGCVSSLTKNGIYLRAVHMSLSPIIYGLWTSITSQKKVIGGVMTESPDDLLFLKDLVESGKMRAVVDRSYPLSEVALAHSYVDGGHKKGNIVVTVG